MLSSFCCGREIPTGISLPQQKLSKENEIGLEEQFEQARQSRPSRDKSVAQGFSPNSGQHGIGDASAQAANWYYVDSGHNRQGPLNTQVMLELVRRAVISQSTFVWREGMSSWVAAGQSELWAGRTQPTERAELAAAPSPIKRPCGLVFVVLYWTFGGLIALFFGSLYEIMGSVFGATGRMPEFLDFGGYSREVSAVVALVGALIEFVGIVLFLLGIVTLAACYGLWTFSKWGLSLAKILSVLFAVINGLALVVSIIVRAGIVLSVCALVISVLVAAYLRGGGDSLLKPLKERIPVKPLDERQWG